MCKTISLHLGKRSLVDQQRSLRSEEEDALQSDQSSDRDSGCDRVISSQEATNTFQSSYVYEYSTPAEQQDIRYKKEKCAWPAKKEINPRVVSRAQIPRSQTCPLITDYRTTSSALKASSKLPISIRHNEILYPASSNLLHDLQASSNHFKLLYSQLPSMQASKQVHPLLHAVN